MPAVGRGAEQFIFRLSPGLRDRIKAAAKTNGRSMNTEVLLVLEEAFPEPAADELTALRNLVAELQAELREMKERSHGPE